MSDKGCGGHHLWEPHQAQAVQSRHVILVLIVTLVALVADADAQICRPGRVNVLQHTLLDHGITQQPLLAARPGAAPPVLLQEATTSQMLIFK